MPLLPAACCCFLLVASAAAADNDIAHSAEYQGTTSARDTAGTLSTGAQVLVQAILLLLGWTALRSNAWAAQKLKAAAGDTRAAVPPAPAAAAAAPTPAVQADPRPYADTEADVKEADVAITLTDEEKEVFAPSPRAPVVEAAEPTPGTAADGSASSVEAASASEKAGADATGEVEAVTVIVKPQEKEGETAEAVVPATSALRGSERTSAAAAAAAKKKKKRAGAGAGRGTVGVATGRAAGGGTGRGARGAGASSGEAAAPVAPLAPAPAAPAGPTFFDHLKAALPVFNPISIWRTAVGAQRESWLLLGACALGLGTAVLAGLLADRAHVFGIVEKVRSVGLDLLVAITLAITAVALVRSRVTAPAGAPGTEDVVMGLRACEETKGWMMLVFLLYHYFDVKAVYNLVRVLVSTYVFLTGYGNALSLSATRGAGVTWTKFSHAFLRINLLVVLISLAMQQPYILYYICPLHTFYTLTTYALYSRRVAQWLPHKGTRFLAAFMLLVVVWHLEGLWTVLFYPLRPLLVTTGDSMSEWAFRSKLDFLSAFAGSAFAEVRPVVLQWLRGASLPRRQSGWGAVLSEEETEAMTAEVPASPIVSAGSAPGAASALAAPGTPSSATPSGSTASRQLKGWALIFGSLSALWLYAVIALPLSKSSYNAAHPYIAWIPIVAFFTLRSGSSALRRTHLSLFAYIGRHSLELYLLQFHVWLGYNAKTNVIPISLPNRFTGSVLQTGLFLLLAVAAFNGTGNFMTFLRTKGGPQAHVIAMVVCLLLLCTSYSFASGSGGA